MKHTFSKNLFKKYVEGKCTEEEKATVESWYLNELKNSTFTPSKDHLPLVQEAIWKGIKPRRSIIPFIKWTAYAAAIIIAILFVYKFQYGKNGSISQQQDSVLLASKTENSMMKLPDGSVVILEKGSKLTMLPAFNKKHNREVTLEGKAFFDIVHNPAKPFIIYTGTVRTTVLGTSFDITAFPGSKLVKVNVIRGVVEVLDTKTRWMTRLPKDYQVVFDDKLEKPQRQQVDATEELSWNSKQSIGFHDVSFKDVKNLLEERFHVKIDLKDPDLQNAEFNVTIRANDDLDRLLDVLCNFNNAIYTYNQDRTQVSIKPKP